MHSRALFWLQAVTVARVPLAAVVATLLLMFDRSLPVMLLAAVVLLAAELTDALDGYLARRLGLVSEFGAMLDPWADSVSRLIVYWGLACSGLALALVPLVMALRDVTVSYCRITWTRKGRSVGARISGKIKAIVQAVAAFGLMLGPLAGDMLGPLAGDMLGPLAGETASFWVKVALSWLVIAVTVYSGVDYFASSFRTGKATESDSERRSTSA